MHKRILIGTIIFFIAFTGQVQAVSPTPATQNSAKLDKQINQLKDKIASRVSELNLVEKRGIIGTVQEVKNNKITLVDIDGRTRYVDVDEITKYSSVSQRGFDLSDITKGTQISALGLYNKESKRILARFISTHVIPTRYNGTITAIDAKTFTLTVTTDDQKEVHITADKAAKIFSYTKDATDLAKSEFSQLSVGDRIAIVGYPDRKDATRLVTDRLIDYINIAKSPNVTMTNPTPTPGTTIAPTSPGTKSISPIR